MRIYLDNAATSWPKPEGVYLAVDRYQREIGAAAGRGAYTSSVEAQRLVDAARRGCARLLGVERPERIVFGSNGTDALNLALHGLLQAGDHVVSTVCEHNSVLRPLADLGERLGIEASSVGCDAQGYVDPDEISRAMRPNTRLVAVTHASNVTGAVQPIAEISTVAREAGALLLLDAAQTAGHIPINVESLGVDLLAASGHKGLLGPLGTGLLYVRSGLEQELRSVRQGGTGGNSRETAQPARMPARYEAGNLNVAALAGLAASTEFLHCKGILEIERREAELTRRLLDGLGSMKEIQVYGPTAATPRVGVVSFSAAGYDPQEFVAAADSAAGLQCRAGLHCAPRQHQALGTLERGGLVRLSVGWSTTPEEIDAALNLISALTAG